MINEIDKMDKLRQAIAEKLLNVEGSLFDFMLHGYTLTAICRKPNEPESFIIVSNDSLVFIDALKETHKKNIHSNWGTSGHLGVLERLEEARRDIKL